MEVWEKEVAKDDRQDVSQKTRKMQSRLMKKKKDFRAWRRMGDV